MIRKLQEPDIDQVADVWLDTNLKAHDFIPAQYWKDNFESVKKMLLQSEVYVYENETTHNIDGFLGLSANDIAGIFVRSNVQRYRKTAAGLCQGKKRASDTKRISKKCKSR